LQLGQVYIQQLRLPEARAACTRAVAIAQTLENPVLEFAAWHNLGEAYLWSGDLEAARSNLERALAKSEGVSPEEIIREGVGYDWWTNTASNLNHTILILGLPDLRAISIDRIAERARSSTHPFTRAVGLLMAVFTGHMRGDLGDFGLGCLRECRTLSDEHGFSELLALLDQHEGFDRFRRGERAEGIAQMESAIEKLDALDSRIMSSWRLVLLATAHIELGEYRAAEDACGKAFALIAETDEQWCEAEVYRVTAEAIIHRSDGELAEAEKHLRKAIDIARNQRARWWELRATTSLARLLARQKKHEEARTMLSDIYNWFTEGFDTADLKDAKTLLDELSA
jgi:tetratricopeptide (TPR) repeat protein